jgi:hypothetical protein
VTPNTKVYNPSTHVHRLPILDSALDILPSHAAKGSEMDAKSP